MKGYPLGPALSSPRPRRGYDSSVVPPACRAVVPRSHRPTVLIAPSPHCSIAPSPHRRRLRRRPVAPSPRRPSTVDRRPVRTSDRPPRVPPVHRRGTRTPPTDRRAAIATPDRTQPTRPASHGPRGPTQSTAPRAHRCRSGGQPRPQEASGFWVLGSHGTETRSKRRGPVGWSPLTDRAAMCRAVERPPRPAVENVFARARTVLAVCGDARRRSRTPIPERPREPG
jgi:hypothetical protein